MPHATIEQLVNVRSQLVEEILAHLAAVAARMAELPSYYPAHLRVIDEDGKTRFDDIRQIVQVVEDRSAFEQWLAQERERVRAAGQDVDRFAYAPNRARPERGEEEERERDRPAPPPPIVWDEHAGERFKRAITLGDPGFGKTWLLRYEARRLALTAWRLLRDFACTLDNLVLPIFARLSDLNQSDNALEDALVAHIGKERSIAFQRFVRKKLTTERCVILLDAWDEVPVELPSDGQSIAYRPHHRQRLGQRLDAFARQFPQPRLLLTSRIVGYTSSPLPDAKELELLAFDAPQTEGFARVWFDDPGQFLAMLQQNPQVRGLARIPLMLALLCRAYQEKQLAFPTRRVELYERCLRGLLRDWKEEKEQREISTAYVEALIELLHAVGFALFSQGHEQFSESLLRQEIGQWLGGLSRSHEFHLRTPSELIAILKHDGVFITAGEHRDAPLLFLHRTFHEYLTARHLAALINANGWKKAVIKIGGNGRNVNVKALIDKNAWLPAWQEVIVLLAGQLDDPALLLQLLMDEQKDDYFRHRLALAALCLPEVDMALKPQLSESFDALTTSAFQLWLQRQRDDTVATVPHLTRALLALGQVNARVDGTPFLDYLIGLLRDPDGVVRGGAALAVRGLGSAATPGTLAALTDLLRDPDGDVRGGAALTVRGLGSAATPGILAALTDLLRDPDGVVRREAAWAVGGLGSATTPGILAILTDLLRDPDGVVRAAAARAVGEIAHVAATPGILAILTDLLQDPAANVRGNATNAVHALGSAATPGVLAAFTGLLRDPDEAVREAAARTVGRLGSATTPGILAALTDLLRDPDRAVRAAVAGAIREIAHVAATPGVLAAFTGLLRDPDEAVREAAAGAVGRLGSATTPDILAAFTGLLRDPDRVVRLEAARALGGLGSTTIPGILETLPGLLRDPDEALRGGAALAVGWLGSAATPDILAAFTDLLRDPDVDVRQYAALAVGWLGSAATPDILAALTDLLRGPDKPVFWAAAGAVGKLGSAAAAPGVLATLHALSRDPDEVLRRAAAEVLGTWAAQGMRIFRVSKRRWLRTVTTWEARSVENLARGGDEKPGSGD